MYFTSGETGRAAGQLPPSLGQLIALADALRNSSLNAAQTEIVRALREGLGLLEERAMGDVKVLETFERVLY